MRHRFYRVPMDVPGRTRASSCQRLLLAAVPFPPPTLQKKKTWRSTGFQIGSAPLEIKSQANGERMREEWGKKTPHPRCPAVCARASFKAHSANRWSDGKLSFIERLLQSRS